MEVHIRNKALLPTELFSPRALKKFHKAIKLPDFLPRSRWVGREPWSSPPLLPPDWLKYPRIHLNLGTLLPCLLFSSVSQITLLAVSFSHSSSQIGQLGESLNESNLMQLCILPKSYSVLVNLSTNFQFFATSVITLLWCSFVIIHSQLYSKNATRETKKIMDLETLFFGISHLSLESSLRGKTELYREVMLLFVGGRLQADVKRVAPRK